MSTVTAETEDHGGRSVFFYTAIAILLAIITLIEIAPLFEWFELGAPVLILLSAIKFVLVIGYFMHLADDASVFSRVFGIPLIGSILMVLVLMAMAAGFDPSPRDDVFPVKERHYENYNQVCHSWLNSAVSNRSYCASPPLDSKRVAIFAASDGGPPGGPPPVDISGMNEAQQLAALRERGEELYTQNCATCHGADGQGTPGTYPPLAGNPNLQDRAYHIDTVINGQSGPIVVNGVEYNGVMAAFGVLNDYNIAAIVTYERTSWGNDHGVVLPREVEGAR